MTTAAGPVVGGWLATHASWRWVFLINIPLALAVVLIANARLPESRDPSASGRLDWPGAVVSAAGLGLLVYGLIESANVGLTHPFVLTAISGGLLLIGAFIVVEFSVNNPMMPLDLFRSRKFTGANLLTFLLYGALGGALFFLPFNLVQVQNYTPAEAGAAWLPFILIIAVLSRWTGALVPVVGARVLLVTGPLITAVGFALAAVPGLGGAYWTTFFPAFLVMGFGMSVAVAPLVTVVMGSVASNRAGIASAINNAVSRAAGLLALAVMGVLVLAVFERELDRRLASSPVRPGVVEQLVQQRLNLAATKVPPAATAEEAQVLRSAIDTAFVAGFRAAMLIAAGLAAASALVAAVTIRTG
jgi:predicted MFS family arabinose efflux permease